MNSNNVKKMSSTLLYLIAPILSAGIFAGLGCVSVNISPGKVEKSEGVKFQPPQAGFREIAKSGADSAWNNPATGSTIAFQSNCGDAAETSLDSVAEDLFVGFEQAKTLKKERVPFDGREALDMEMEGKVDGVQTRVRALVYRKNDCAYVLTFVGLPKSLVADTANKPAASSDLAEFSKFISTFKAP
ncbi:MAG: hypothetical protein U1E10_18975 [Bdellovibrionales bacterium]|nr:hypothetical protein [Bdellovibrionales bacterium]